MVSGTWNLARLSILLNGCGYVEHWVHLCRNGNVLRFLSLPHKEHSSLDLTKCLLLMKIWCNVLSVFTLLLSLLLPPPPLLSLIHAYTRAEIQSVDKIWVVGVWSWTKLGVQFCNQSPTWEVSIDSPQTSCLKRPHSQPFAGIIFTTLFLPEWSVITSLFL